MSIKKSDIRAILKSFKDEDMTQDEAISKVLDMAHSEIDTLKDERDELQEQLKEAQKKPDETELQKKYDKLQKEYEAYKNDQEAKNTKTSKADALKEALKASGLSEAGQSKALKYTDLEKIELDDKGAIKGVDKLLEEIKTEWSDYTVKESSAGAKTVQGDKVGGSGTKRTMEEIYAKDERGRYKLSTAERQAALVELNSSN